MFPWKQLDFFIMNEVEVCKNMHNKVIFIPDSVASFGFLAF